MNELQRAPVRIALPVKPISEDEVFIGWQNLFSALEPRYTQHTRFKAAHGLWQSILQNTGVVFGSDERLIEVRPRGLHCVRILDDKPLVSIDGLVDGLTSGELAAGGNSIGPRRLAGIVHLARTFTPEREAELVNAEKTLAIPPIGQGHPHFHYF